MGVFYGIHLFDREAMKISLERQSNKKLYLTIPLVKTETLQSFKQKKAHFHPLAILTITPTLGGTWSGP